MNPYDLFLQHKTHVYQTKIESAAGDILRGRYFQAFNKLYTHSASGKRDFHRFVLRMVQKEKKELGSAPSALRHKENDIKGSLADFRWNAVVQELGSKCPTLNAALNGATTGKKSMIIGRRTKGKVVRGVIAAIIAYHYNPGFVTSFQKLNSIRMWTSGCKSEV